MPPLSPTDTPLWIFDVSPEYTPYAFIHTICHAMPPCWRHEYAMRHSACLPPLLTAPHTPPHMLRLSAVTFATLCALYYYAYSLMLLGYIFFRHCLRTATPLAAMPLMFSSYCLFMPLLPRYASADDIFRHPYLPIITVSSFLLCVIFAILLIACINKRLILFLTLSGHMLLMPHATLLPPCRLSRHYSCYATFLRHFRYATI